MIGIYGNKQTMPESQKKELFSAGITYMEKTVKVTPKKRRKMTPKS